MAKKTVKMRPWTATDVYKLRGLAKRKVGVTKIARALKRTAGATAVKAHQLGVSLDTREQLKRPNTVAESRSVPPEI